ncbi:MAG: formylmethanofuran dehydrogenase [Desulfuromonas sp.]|nr:MAG: formylmethanofuran dehydrogenase [Desulfuromonas sp.]
MNYESIVAFHGHSCPGLAIGYRMSLAALEALHSQRAADEELVAIVENDACGVDALQCLTGCTFGKGNLIFHDYGKQVYTLFSRTSGSGVRVLYHGDGLPAELRNDRPARIEKILTTADDKILTVTPVSVPLPEPAEILASHPCEQCKEQVMASRLQKENGRQFCIPCLKQR